MKSDTAVQDGIGTSGADRVDGDSGGLPEARGGQTRLTLRRTDAVEMTPEAALNHAVSRPGIAGTNTALTGEGLTLTALTAIVESTGLPEMMSTLVRLLHDLTGVEAIGIRLKSGDDYPYYETYGIPLQVVRKDSALCSSDSGGKVICGFDGKPILGCLCGNVIRGVIEPGSPYYTDRGSFWTNDLTEFLYSVLGRSLPEAARIRMADSRYGSVALIPVGSDRNIVGLIQFSDRRPGLFTAALIEELEWLAGELIELDGERHLLTLAVDRTERRRIVQELERTNNSLRAERSMLENKNMALKEIMEQIDQYKRSTSQQLQANVNRVIRPMLQLLTDKLPPADRRLVSLLDNTLQNLIDPFVGKLESLSYSLTPREVEVCHMIRNGFSSKQIASLLNVSVFTVNNQRRSIRRKLEIADGETHLESYLKRL